MALVPKMDKALVDSLFVKPLPWDEFFAVGAAYTDAKKAAEKAEAERINREAKAEQDRKWQLVFAEHLTEAHMERQLAARRPFDPVWDDPRNA